MCLKVRGLINLTPKRGRTQGFCDDGTKALILKNVTMGQILRDIIYVQPFFRRMLRRIHEKRAGMKKLEDSKKRWRRKIEGEDYVSSEEEEEPPTPPRALSPFVQQDPHSALVDFYNIIFFVSFNVHGYN